MLLALGTIQDPTATWSYLRLTELGIAPFIVESSATVAEAAEMLEAEYTAKLEVVGEASSAVMVMGCDQESKPVTTKGGGRAPVMLLQVKICFYEWLFLIMIDTYVLHDEHEAFNSYDCVHFRHASFTKRF
eukprot:SAG31_NODE_421_length_15868_cov_8.966453_15_plen_131_part_00